MEITNHGVYGIEKYDYYYYIIQRTKESIEKARIE
jgi:hypothetical protein